MACVASPASVGVLDHDPVDVVNADEHLPLPARRSIR
jgi:hypothetical protein